MEIRIPYGNAALLLAADAVDEVLAAELSQPAPLCGEGQIVLDAMASPYGALGLTELARGKRTATIIISDHTRPVPSQLIIPPMLAELRAGSPEIEVTLLVATGAHRAPTRNELIKKLGTQIVDQERIVIHDCDDAESLISLGRLPSGAELRVNRWAVETDLLLAEGLIEPHFFAGFSGGGKSVLPGVCGRQTILENHCASFIDHPEARTGKLRDNPIQIDIRAAARLANLQYIVNVVINHTKQTVAAFAGDWVAAHAAGCEFLSMRSRVAPSKRGDIVITSNGGAPLDQNIYQAVKGLCTAEAAAAPGAVLIICAQCADGTGGDQFYRAVRDCQDAPALLAMIRQTPANATVQDQWQYQILARIMQRHQIIFVTEPALAETVGQMKLSYAPDLATALRQAKSIMGEQSYTIVIPDGVAVIVDGH